MRPEDGGLGRVQPTWSGWHDRGLSDDRGAPATEASGPAGGPPSRLTRNIVIVAAIGFFVAAIVGDVFFLAQVDRHPAIFIGLNARNRNLVLAKSYLSWEAFFGIATIRLLASDPLFFVLGRWYGDAGVRWIEKRSVTYGPMARTAERWFGKASYPLVLLAPNNYICLFAGAGGMSVGVFAALNVVGTVVRLTILWFVTESVSEPLDVVRGFIVDNRLLVFGISAALVVLSLWNDRRNGGGEVGGLLHLDDESTEAEPAEAEAADRAKGSSEPTGDAASEANTAAGTGRSHRPSTAQAVTDTDDD